MMRGVCVLLASMLVVGCGHRPPPLPKTYPVHGKVTHHDGAIITGGRVQFQSEAEPSVTTTAMIRSDGAYALTTTRDGLRAEGAVLGPNRVIVVPTRIGNTQNAKPTSQGQLNIAPTTYPTPYIVECRDNEFNLVVGQHHR